VSGLSDAIIIVEAAARSGTLATAAHALAQGRDVFVVPGNITSPLSAGCNALLKQGAMPITCAQDVLDSIAPQFTMMQNQLPLGSNQLETNIITSLQAGERDGDTILMQLGVATGDFNQALTMLEITGTIRALGGNQWTLR
ncbi:MAG: DNA-processing protein DprA, partial [Candidatus Saccharimonadales bacterium]